MITALTEGATDSTTARRKTTRSGITTQVFSYEPVDNYDNNLIGSIKETKVKQAAKNIEPMDYEDSGIINFFE